MRRFLNLTSARRRLIFEALVLVVVLRIAVRLVPFRVLRRWAGRPSREIAAGNAADVAWAVATAARLTYARDTCLPEALAASMLLRARGIATELKFGIHSGVRGTSAHAWLVAPDGTLIGLRAADPYVPLVRPTGTPDA